MGICFVTIFYFFTKTSSQPYDRICGCHVGICFDPMKFDRMLSFLVKACDAMVKINYLSNKYWIQKYFPQQPSSSPNPFPKWTFFHLFICGNHQGKKVTLGMHSLSNLSSLSQSSCPRKKKKRSNKFLKK